MINPRECNTCGQRAMDMDMDPYCAAVNQPYGQRLSRGRPQECGPDAKLWQIDTRRGNHDR